jgi:hypothetical protein
MASALNSKRRDVPLDLRASSSCEPSPLLSKRYHPILLDSRFTNTTPPRLFDDRIRTRLADDMTTYEWLVFVFLVLLFRFLLWSICVLVPVGRDWRFGR